LVVGLVLLGVVLAEIDLSALFERVRLIGWGLAVVVGLYFLAFLIDSYTWQLTVADMPLGARWLYRTWKVRMVGEVFNSVVPAGSMGGEPVKVVLLKRYYGIGYQEGTASIILAKTINMLALVAFLIAGYALMTTSAALPLSFQIVGGAGLAALGVGTGLFFLAQRFRISSLTGGWLSRWPAAARLRAFLHHIHDMDDRLVRFYTRHRGRFVVALALAFANWVLGALEIYYTLLFLEHPVSMTEAWIIEAAAQLVRAGVFFIPAGIGAQEGTFLLVCAAITGSPVLGVAVAMVRRFREILWILWGVLLGAMFSLRAPHAETENQRISGGHQP